MTQRLFLGVGGERPSQAHCFGGPYRKGVLVRPSIKQPLWDSVQTSVAWVMDIPGFGKMTTLQLAGDGDGLLGSNVLGLFTGEAQGNHGMRAQIVALYDEIRPSLYKNLVFLGFDPNGADDVIQEAFLELVRHLEAGRTIENMRAWIFRATYSLSVSAHRKQRKIGLRGEEAETFIRQLPAADLNPEQAYLSQERMRRYEAAVERLTIQQRRCLLLRKEGLRYREIAVALGISPSRVPQLLERAVSRLMEEIYG